MSTQNMAALQEANRIRIARAKLRREVFALPVEESWALLATVFENPPNYLLSASVLDVLRWGRGMGASRATGKLRVACIGLSKQVRQLTPRQASDLARGLRGLDSLVEADESDRVDALRGIAA